MVGLIVIILLMALVVVATIWWCERKVSSRDITCGMDLWSISRREFDKMIGSRKFHALNSRVATPYLSQFFAGRVNGFHTCIFSIAVGRYSPIMLVGLLSSINLPFPNFVIRPKSFNQEMGDMLGLRQHHAAYPQSLIDMYDVSSEDDGLFAARLTPEVIAFFLDHEGQSVEALDGSLLVTTSLVAKDENYEPAIAHVHALARTLGVTAKSDIPVGRT